ncbi:vitelline membrane outer layer protein 1 [Procambarus clarkii]|uniref:vitelline membrane outer layer protein 1 n=1 Tax=Procambarus clarkii TaxID=6728 RepID=UPI003742D511
MVHQYLISLLEMNTFGVFLPLLASSCLLLGVATQDVKKGSAVRNVTQELTINNGVDWGDWGPIEFCDEGSFVHGFEVLFDPTGALDETAVNGVKLYCANDDHYDTGYVTSTVGSSGQWQGMRVCHEGFMTGFRAEVLEPQGVVHDDVAVENVEMQCGYNGEIFAGVLDLPKFTPGTWSDWQQCEQGSTVCGLQVRFEAVSVGDDAATTDLSMYCCKHQ